MKPADNISNSIKRLHVPTSAELDEKIHREISNAVVETENKKSAEPELNIWRTIMKSRIIKLAVSVVIIIGVLVGINYLDKQSSVAWGSLVERVEKIKTVAYQMKMTMKGLPNMPPSEQTMEMQAKVYQSSEYGMCVDGFRGEKLVSQTYVLPQQQVLVSVMPMQKKYMKMHLNDDILQKTKQQFGDPKKMVEEFMKYKYTELEPNNINGKKAAGIESRDLKMGGGMFDKVLARLWVDVETQLPVLMEMETSGKQGEMEMKMVMDEFDWAIELDKSLFEPNIPADYTLMAEIKMPNVQDANAFADGLSLVAKWTGGKYPSTLSMINVMKEVHEAWCNIVTRMRESQAKRKWKTL